MGCAIVNIVQKTRNFRTSFPGGFKDRACQVEGQGQHIADDHGFGYVGQTKAGSAFEQPAHPGGVAALGLGLSAHA